MEGLVVGGDVVANVDGRGAGAEGGAGEGDGFGEGGSYWAIWSGFIGGRGESIRIPGK